jgi:N-acetyl-gamma-glutamyl-phosphate reductase
MSLKKINIAVIGATGYTGLDLVFLLSKHPKVNISYLCATKNLGKKISFFDNRIKKKLPKISSIKKINWNKIDLVFFSLPNGEAQKIIKKTYLKYLNLKFIDLSADFRLVDYNNYKKVYKLEHKAQNFINKSYLIFN